MMIPITAVVILLHIVIVIRLLTVDKREQKPNRLYEPTMKQMIGFCLLILVLCGGIFFLMLPAILSGYLGDWMMRRNGKNAKNG